MTPLDPFTSNIIVLLRRAALEIERLRSIHARCKYCGAPLHLTPKARPKIFCNATCRAAHRKITQGASYVSRKSS